MSTTRSQAKQEEQLTTLLPMLEEQKQEQQRQSERLKKLLQHHEQSQHMLEERQKNTIQQMGMLQEDVCSLKTLLLDKVESTQAELAIIVERQKQLKVEQKITRQELRDELMQEVKRSLQEEISSRSVDSVLSAPAAMSAIGGGVEAPATVCALAN